MKLTRTLIGFSAGALFGTVVLVAVHFTAWAKESAPAPTIRVDSTPINRDARLGNSFAPIVKSVAPSVVNIFSTRFVKEQPMRNPFFGNPLLQQFFGDPNSGNDDGRERTLKEEYLGSGVIVSPNGYILTANHVVDDADEIKVSIADNKKEYTARLIGKDKATDIAVLKIDEDNLPAVTLADSDQLEVGDIVLAIGNPLDVGQTVTMGIVSALGRNGLGLNLYEDFIQTDAAINPGNSGGALVDVRGRLVGINTAIAGRRNQGIGFAVPVDLARNVMERLINGGKVTRGYLGVAPRDLDEGLAQEFGLPDQNGALVDDVVPGSPADKAGLLAGDVILAVNGKAITGGENLSLTISQLEPGSGASLKLIRDGHAKTIDVTLGELPTDFAASDDGSSDSSANNSTDDTMDGLTVQDLDSEIRHELHAPDSLQGALITDVRPDSNFADAGLEVNDVLVGINHQSVTDADDASRLWKGAKGDQILIKVWRRSKGWAGTHFLSVDNTPRK
jgi:serine protease Do